MHRLTRISKIYLRLIWSSVLTVSRRLRAPSGVAAFALTTLFLLGQPGATQAQPFAYVANFGSNNVSVINTASNTVVATVAVGNSPRGVAITPDGSFAYVANLGSNNVSVIATASNTVAATVGVGIAPTAVAITPDGSFAYVANNVSNNVSVIATASNTVAATVGVGIAPTAVAITPDGSFAYVANDGSDNVSVIATAGNTVVATVTVGDAPFGVAITPDGSFAYVANLGSNNVSVIETAGNTVVATVTVGDAPFGVAITPDGSFAYVTNLGSGSVSVIETGGNTVAATVTVGAVPVGVAITPDGSFAYVTNNGSGNVSVIATASNTVAATVTVGDGPEGVAITPAPPQVTATKTDVLLIDNDNDGQADPGDRVRYTVVITNAGGLAAAVTFNDTPDANSSLAVGSVATTAAVTTGNTVGDTDVAVAVGVISGSGPVTITFDVDINSPLSSTVDEICNQGTVSGDNFTTVSTDDPDDPTSSSDQTCTPIDKDPSVDVTKDDALTTDNNQNGLVDIGDLLTYTVVITNSGNGVAEDVIFNDLATNHPNATLVDGSVTASPGTVTNGNSGGPDTDVTVDIGTIAADGGSVTITFQVTVSDPSPDSEVCNQGTVSGSNFADILTDDPATGDPADATCTPVEVNAPPSLPHEFLFLADEFVESKQHKLIQGNIFSNNDIEIKKGKNSEIVGDLVAVDDIEIAKKNDVDGNVIAGDDVDNDGDVSGTITEDASVAEIPIGPIAPFAFGDDDFEVDKKESETLDPGAYKEVEVKKSGTLLLRHDGNSGEYFLKTLELDKKATLCIDVSNGPVVINVARELVFGKESEVIIKPNGQEDTELVTFNFGDDDDKKEAVEIGKKATVLGTIIAPDAWVVLQSKSRFKGAICAENIVVKSKVVALHHSSTSGLPKMLEDDEEEDEELLTQSIPMEFELNQNYPNPFNPSTNISFALPQAGEVTLAIYNLRGQLVATLHEGALPAGRHQMVWDGKDRRGLQVASGVYVYRLETDGFVATKKLTLMK